MLVFAIKLQEYQTKTIYTRQNLFESITTLHKCKKVCICTEQHHRHGSKMCSQTMLHDRLLQCTCVQRINYQYSNSHTPITQRTPIIKKKKESDLTTSYHNPNSQNQQKIITPSKCTSFLNDV